MIFTRILVPTDFSPNSERALQAAAEIATRFGASLHLLHVQTTTDLVPASIPGMEGVTEAWFHLIAEQERQAHQNLAAAIAALQPPVAQTSYELRSGSPWEAILAAAEAVHADLIVMGTHGRGPFTRFLMGSVADRVVRTATCPVLTIRQHEDADDSATS